MKTYTPRGLAGDDLRRLLADLGWLPVDAARYLQVTERSVWRWLADGSAPFAVVALLWHVSPDGVHTVGLDHGNGVMYERGYVRSMEATTARLQAQCHRLELDLDRATLAAGGAVPANCPVFRTG